jgi:hypothetical protein
MSAQDFLALAEKNDALLSPETTKKARQSTIDWIDNHEFYGGLFGDVHAISKNSLPNKVINFLWGGAMLAFFIICVPMLAMYAFIAILLLCALIGII